jgi:hypothetical protein
VKVTPSITQKSKNTKNVNPKFIRDEIFLENKKRYFGTFIFENIDALSNSDDIPVPVASLKKENTIFPQKR